MKVLSSRRILRSAKVCAAAASAVLLVTNAHAGFFIPKGSTMAMGMYTPSESTFEVSYGLTRDTSIAASVSRMSDEKVTLTRLQASRLVGRVFHEDGIGNAYVFAGPLAVSGNATNGTRYGVHGGVWADYETRRIYGRVSWHGVKASAYRSSEVVAQAALAPYLADYEDIASWGGVQLKRKNGATQTELTPFVRFFRKDWWIDAGMSVNRANRKDLFVNVMHLF